MMLIASVAHVFARGFLRGRYVRRTLSLLGALLAFLGGILIVVAALPSRTGELSVAQPFRLVLGFGALLGAWLIHRGGKAILFPRIRLTTAGLMTFVIGALLLVTGPGADALLILAAGMLALVATAF